MHIKSYDYRELENTDREWVLDRFTTEKINLFVGQNASGKTRILNTISGLAKFISTAQPVALLAGEWDIELSDGSNEITLSIAIRDHKILREIVVINGCERLVRGPDGSGQIYYEREDKMLDFKMPEFGSAMAFKRDALQHSYLEPIFSWASCFKHFHFSTDLGRSTLHLMPFQNEAGSSERENSVPSGGFDQNAVVEQYGRSYTKHGDAYDEAILADLQQIGYDCEEIRSQHAEDLGLIEGRAPILLYVKERDMKGLTPQFQMSTGMFRALSIIIHTNSTIMDGGGSTLLIDDIGEGLDFYRATELIKLLIAKCEDKDIQLLMTSNDRFVMNSVSLTHWHIVQRSGHKVRVRDNQNSPEVFEKFKYLGLSNFDLFAANAFDGLSIH